MYEDHFSLSGAPFKLNPDPKFFFGSRSHNKAMAYLHYGLKQAEGFIVITGPIGSGKTMVISQLLDQLTSSNVVAAQLLTSNIEPEELLDHILSAFRLEPEGEGRTGKLEAFEDYLFDQLNRGRRVLLIMDEAQNLPFGTLEELRMLSNLDYDGTPLFQVFLVGQPEFRDVLQSQRLEQLRQRVIASYHLENLSLEETTEYIYHRLSITGWREDPTFSDDALEAIFRETGGRPRRINTVCNRIMLFCSIEDKHHVTGEIANTVIGELHEEELEARDVGAPDDRMPAVKNMDDAADDKPTLDERGDAPVAKTVSAEGDDGMQDAEPAQEAPSTEDGDEAQTGEREPMESAHENGDAEADRDQARETAPSSDAPVASRDSSLKAKPTGDGSVFDRVRAKRSGAPGGAPTQATLEDVANAIAKADAGELLQDPGADDALDDAAAMIAPLQAVQSTEWRRQVRHAIDETRSELKQAHASVGRLKKTLTDMQRQRRERRDKIAAGMARAETALNEVRKDIS